MMYFLIFTSHQKIWVILYQLFEIM